MFPPRRQLEDRQPDYSLILVIVSLVAMSFLLGFGAATLVFRIEGHGNPDAVLPGVILSLFGVIVQYSILRLLIRHRIQTSN